jgi:hypothetical protein
VRRTEELQDALTHAWEEELAALNARCAEPRKDVVRCV